MGLVYLQWKFQLIWSRNGRDESLYTLDLMWQKKKEKKERRNTAKTTCLHHTTMWWWSHNKCLYCFYMTDASLWDSSDKVKLSWEEYFDIPLPWHKVYSLLYRISIDSNSRMFQYKLLFKFLPCNKTLCLWGLIDSPICSLCKEEEESVVHLFWNCHITANFWALVDDWFFNITDIHLHINARNIIFGNLSDRCPILSNVIVLLGKMFIFKSRKHSLSLPSFISYVSYFYKLEYNIAYRQGKLQKHRGKWGNLGTYFDNIELIMIGFSATIDC